MEKQKKEKKTLSNVMEMMQSILVDYIVPKSKVF